MHAQEKGRKRRAPACAAHRAAGRPLRRRGGCFSANCPCGVSRRSWSSTTFVHSIRPRKRPKKKGASAVPGTCLPVCVQRTGRRATRRQAAQAGLPCGPFGRFWAVVLGGSARKSPFNPAPKAGEARRVRGRDPSFPGALIPKPGSH